MKEPLKDLTPEERREIISDCIEVFINFGIARKVFSFDPDLATSLLKDIAFTELEKWEDAKT